MSATGQRRKWTPEEKLQIVLEDMVSFFVSQLESNLGPKGREFLPLLGTIFVFIFLGNMMGQVPGLGAPTSNINVPFACALTVVLYYHFHGVKAQGPISYIKRSSATCRACSR